MKLSWVLPAALALAVAGFTVVGLTGLDRPNRGPDAQEQPQERVEAKREDDGGDPVR